MDPPRHCRVLGASSTRRRNYPELNLGLPHQLVLAVPQWEHGAGEGRREQDRPRVVAFEDVCVRVRELTGGEPSRIPTQNPDPTLISNPTCPRPLCPLAVNDKQQTATNQRTHTQRTTVNQEYTQQTNSKPTHVHTR